MTLYLDTSSLVKLYVSESGAEDVDSLVGRATVVATSQVTYPEARAALARRRRERRLSAAEFRRATEALDTDWPTYLLVEVTHALCRRAGDLAERHRLRGFDSIHLASFMEVASRAGAAKTHFSSFDSTLTKAANAVMRTLRRPPGRKGLAN